MSANVVVDFGVSTTATGEIRVFGQSAPTIQNKVVASFGMSASSLYSNVSNVINGLIEFQGQDNDITAKLNTAFTTDATAATRKAALANGIHLALTTGSLNASEAAPFNDAKYTDAGYKNYTSFGSLALGAYANYLFGHVDATAAIDNDTTFITKMNGRTVPPTPNAGEADLANKLADAIFGMSTANATAIAKQVVGQDAGRAMGVDNDNQGVDGWQKLLFRQGDKIYVSVTLTKPTVSVLGSNTAQQSEPSQNLFSPDITYMIEITLSA